jgi:hypothetical protein
MVLQCFTNDFDFMFTFQRMAGVCAGCSNDGKEFLIEILSSDMNEGRILLPKDS